MSPRIKSLAVAFGALLLLVAPGRSHAGSVVIAPLAHVEVSGTGPVNLVLIPAYLFDWSAWAPFMERNKDRYTMYAVTLPGFGGSEAPPRDPLETQIPWLDSAVEAVAQMIVERKIKDPIVIGHALGGHMALRLGYEWPDKIAKVVTVDGMAAFMVGGDMTPQQRAATVNKQLAPRFRAVSDAEWSAQLLPMMRGMVSDEHTAQWLAGMAATTPKTTAVEYYLELIKSDITPWLFKLRLPTLAIATVPPAATAEPGAIDRMKDGWRRQLSAVETAQVVFFEGVKHFAYLDAPEAFDKAIADFLAGKIVEGVTVGPASTAPAAPPAQRAPAEPGGPAPGAPAAPKPAPADKPKAPSPLLPPSNPIPGTKPR